MGNVFYPLHFLCPDLSITFSQSKSLRKKPARKRVWEYLWQQTTGPLTHFISSPRRLRWGILSFPHRPFTRSFILPQLCSTFFLTTFFFLKVFPFVNISLSNSTFLILNIWFVTFPFQKWLEIQVYTQLRRLFFQVQDLKSPTTSAHSPFQTFW